MQEDMVDAVFKNLLITFVCYGLQPATHKLKMLSFLHYFLCKSLFINFHGHSHIIDFIKLLLS